MYFRKEKGQSWTLILQCIEFVPFAFPQFLLWTSSMCPRKKSRTQKKNKYNKYTDKYNYRYHCLPIAVQVSPGTRSNPTMSEKVEKLKLICTNPLWSLNECLHTCLLGLWKMQKNKNSEFFFDIFKIYSDKPRITHCGI